MTNERSDRDQESTESLHRALREELNTEEGTTPAHGPPSPVRETQELPERIGHYRILRKIGEGGFGVVYECEQEKPKRSIALKVIRAGRSSGDSLRRFEQEAQVLGRLQHPGIAQIFEAGAEDIGQGPQPFFAMEYIRGRGLREYVAENHLAPRARLALVSKICDAVHHAHQKGVIHRDLKPGNILVDDTGQPKILDFGVARVTDSDVQITTIETDVQKLIGTLPYMSPEQAAGDPNELDIRSDVYALGVIAYELLADRLPYDLTRKMIHEAARVIQEEDPTPLSSIDRVFRGDVETIVAKALEKDKTRRYQSAAELAADIQRFLSDEPIWARPPSAIYQLRKFARRNKALVGGITAVFIVLVAGVIVSMNFALGEAQQRRLAALRLADAEVARDEAQKALHVAEEARAAERTQRKLAQQREADAVAAEEEQNRARKEAEQARDEAERQAAISRAVNDFLNDDLLASVDPVKAKGKEVTVREVLDTAAQKIIEGRFTDQPSVEVQLRQTIGWVYYSLGRNARARQHLERALSLCRAVYGSETLEEAQTLESLAFVYASVDPDYRRSCELAREVLRIRQRLLGPDDALTLRIRGDLAMFEAFERGENAAGLDDLTLEMLARIRNQSETPAQMREYINKLLLDVERQWASGDREGAIARITAEAQPVLAVPLLAKRVPLVGGAYAMRLNEEGTFPNAAEAMATAAVEVGTSRLGEGHPNTIYAIESLGTIRREHGSYEEARPLLAKALDLRRRVLGDDHPWTLRSIINMGLLLQSMGQYPEAEPYWREALAGKRRVLGDDHPDTLMSINNMGGLLNKLARHDEAAELLLAGEAAARRVWIGDNARWSGTYLAKLGEARVGLGEYPAGEETLLEAYALLSAGFGADHERTTKTIKRLVTLYESWNAAEPGQGYAEKAAEWRAKLEEEGTKPRSDGGT